MKNTVQGISTPVEISFNEAMAIILARRFGTGVLTGIEQACINTDDGGTIHRMNNATYLKRYGTLRIGIGCGAFTCSPAAEIADQLGIRRNAKVGLVLRKIEEHGKPFSNIPFNLSQCVQLLNDYRWTPCQIEEWLNFFFSLYFSESTTYCPTSSAVPEGIAITFPVFDQAKRPIWNLYSRWLQEKNLKVNNPLVQQLTKQMSRLGIAEPSRQFDPAECTALICAHRPYDGTNQTAYQWIKPLFDAALHSQEQFLAAQAIFEKQHVIAMRPGDNCRPQDVFRIMAISPGQNQSDNRRLIAATRFRNKCINVLIIGRPNGNIGIFLLHRDTVCIEFPWIVAAIRLEQLISNGIDLDSVPTGFADLSMPEIVEHCGEWCQCLNDDNIGFALVNGTFRRPGVMPTNLPFDMLTQVATDICEWMHSGNGWDAWISKRRAKTSR
ncbi:MAG: hypothetical protein WC505_02350 [Patescibacteria group bacterium]